MHRWTTGLLAYSGLFPLTHLGSGGDGVHFHRKQGAALFALVLAWCLLLFTLVTVDMLLSFTTGGLLEGQVPTEGLSLPYAILAAFVLAGCVGLLGLAAWGLRNAVRGEARALPLLGRWIATREGVYRGLRALWVLLVAAMLVFATVAATAMDDEPADVHFLYTLRDPIPESAFRLSAVPLTVSAKFRGDSVFAGPVTEANVERAFAEGRFVIVGTHGMETGFPTDDGAWIGPQGATREGMDHLYFGACNIGASRPDWEARFPGARIVSVDRLFHPMEGWYYLVFSAPQELHAAPGA